MVSAAGGTFYICSSIDLSGQQQLEQASGLAAILQYPLPDLDELEEITVQANMLALGDDKDSFEYQC